VKLLLDENLSDRIIFRIGDLFPGSMHVKTVGLSDADDDVVWEWAKQHGFTIASKDTDFHQRAIVFSHPPKVIWLRVGNCQTNVITILHDVASSGVRSRILRSRRPNWYPSSWRKKRWKPRCASVW
jgi:predicted nuclease of predicted toxin-antitoxin system